MQNFADFKAALQNKLNSIMNENQDINSAFFNQDSGAFTMYTFNLPPFYSVMNKCQSKIANLFNDIVTHGNTLVAQITGGAQSSGSAS